MIKIVQVSILLLSLNSCVNKNICSNFKTGRFEYSKPEYSEWKVVRTDSSQTEINSINGIEIYSSIFWESDCEYVLTYKKVKNSEYNEIIGKKVDVKIIKTFPDRYICISKSDTINLELEMIKVE